LLRTTGREGPDAVKVVNALVSRLGKSRALERLALLQQRVGPCQVIMERSTDIENRIRMSCPRCRVELPRAEMARHLWTEHQLLLDGRRVRGPWRMIKAWLKDYRRHGDAELLVRCR